MREGPGFKRLKALGPCAAWRELRAACEIDQVALWLELFRRRFDRKRYQDALARAEAAVDTLGGSPPEVWLQQSGVAVLVSDAPATFGTAIVRAWFDSDKRRVTVFERPLDALTAVFSACADGAPDRATLRSAIIGHEAFHFIDRECPQTIAETAAHIFAGRVSSLGCFGGTLDALQYLARHWT